MTAEERLNAYEAINSDRYYQMSLRVAELERLVRTLENCLEAMRPARKSPEWYSANSAQTAGFMGSQNRDGAA